MRNTRGISNEKWLYYIVLLLSCSSIFIGCAKINQNKQIKREFTTEDLLEDYDYMWGMLESDYLFFSILEEQGIDVENIKEVTRVQISNMEPDIGDYYRTLDGMFLKLNYFAHLQVASVPVYEIYQRYYNNVDSPSSCWRNVLQNEQVQVTYTELLLENIFADAQYTYPEVEKSYDKQRNAVIFRMKSFDTGLLERDETFIQDYLDTLGGAPVEHIIFDVTGNHGGNDLYWMDNIAAAFGGSYTLTMWRYLRETSLTSKYFFDGFSLESLSEVTKIKSLTDNLPEPIGELPKDHEIPEFVQQLELTHFIKSENEYTWSPQLSDEVLNAKRWVLIDNYTYSSADKFAYFCKSTGWATLVGRSTHGDGVGDDPILINLPNTGLLIRFSASVGENTSGQLNTLYGTAPDYFSKRYETPMDTLYQLIDEGIEQYSITTAYDYPVVPESDAWNELSSFDEKVAVCQIPEDILYEMNTASLVESVVSCPIIVYMFAHNSLEFGYNQVKGYFNGLGELCEREDAVDELKIYAETLDAEDILSVEVVETLIEYISKDYENNEI